MDGTEVGGLSRDAMSGKKDEETTAFFQVPPGLLRRASGDDTAPDTERQPGSLKPPVPNWDEATHRSVLTAPATTPPAPPTTPPSALPQFPPTPPIRPLVDPPRLRRSSSRPEEAPISLVPLTESSPEEDTLVTLNRDELLRKAKER